MRPAGRAGNRRGAGPVVNPTRNRVRTRSARVGVVANRRTSPDVVPQRRPGAHSRGRRWTSHRPQSRSYPGCRLPWHHRPLVIAAAVLAVVAGSGGVTALALRADTHALPARSEPSGSLTGTPAAVSPAGAGDAPRTVVVVPALAPVGRQAAAFTETVVAAPLPEAVAPVAEGPVSLILTLCAHSGAAADPDSVDYRPAATDPPPSSG